MPQDVVKAGFYGNSYSHFKIEITKKENCFYQLNQKKKYVYTADGSFINEKGTSKLNFITEKNGKVYLRESTYELSPGLGQNVLTHYLAQKLETMCYRRNSCCMGRREGGKFYLVNEKFNSINYLGQQIPLNTQITLKDGYWDGKITGRIRRRIKFKFRDEWSGYKGSPFLYRGWY